MEIDEGEERTAHETQGDQALEKGEKAMMKRTGFIVLVILAVTGIGSWIHSCTRPSRPASAPRTVPVNTPNTVPQPKGNPTPGSPAAKLAEKTKDPKPGECYTPPNYPAKYSTLSEITEIAYGHASWYHRLAAYDHIADPNLIIAGEALYVPTVTELNGMAPAHKEETTSLMYQDHDDRTDDAETVEKEPRQDTSALATLETASKDAPDATTDQAEALTQGPEPKPIVRTDAPSEEQAQASSLLKDFMPAMASMIPSGMYMLRIPAERFGNQDVPTGPHQALEIDGPTKKGRWNLTRSTSVLVKRDDDSTVSFTVSLPKPMGPEGLLVFGDLAFSPKTFLHYGTPIDGPNKKFRYGHSQEKQDLKVLRAHYRNVHGRLYYAFRKVPHIAGDGVTLAFGGPVGWAAVGLDGFRTLAQHKMEIRTNDAYRRQMFQRPPPTPAQGEAQ